MNLLRYEELRDVVPVGHSHAGKVIAGVADQALQRIQRLVCVDTWSFPDGVAQIDLEPPKVRHAQEQQVATQGEGWPLPLPSWQGLDRATSFAGMATPSGAQCAGAPSTIPSNCGCSLFW